MASLNIALQEGFWGDPVTIRVDGREVYRKDDVRTRTQIGLADSFTVESEPPLNAPPGDSGTLGELTVAVSVRDLAGEIRVQPAETPFLGVSVRDGELRFTPSPAPFGYL